LAQCAISRECALNSEKLSQLPNFTSSSRCKSFRRMVQRLRDELALVHHPTRV
jgi:hypothetical protein